MLGSSQHDVDGKHPPMSPQHGISGLYWSDEHDKNGAATKTPTLLPGSPTDTYNHPHSKQDVTTSITRRATESSSDFVIVE